jgi:hypothetical protein
MGRTEDVKRVLRRMNCGYREVGETGADFCDEVGVVGY